MNRRKFLLQLRPLLVIMITLCSLYLVQPSYGNSRLENFLKGTQDFFIEDIPSFFAKGAERIQEWWNGSDIKAIEELKGEVQELKDKIEFLTKSMTSYSESRVSAEQTLRALQSQNQELDKRKKELQDRQKHLESLYAELNARTLSQDQRQAELDNREAELMQQQQKYSVRAIHEQAQKLYERLASNEHVRRFLEAGMLDRIDSVKFFLYDRTYGGATENNTPYGTLTVCLDPDKFGFINTLALRNALKSLLRTHALSLRGNSATILVRKDMNADWNSTLEKISSEAFYSLEDISLGLYADKNNNNTERNIAFLNSQLIMLMNSDNKALTMRIFFRTGYDGLYAMAVLQLNGQGSPFIYLVSNGKLISRRNLQRELRKSTDFNMRSDEVSFYLNNSPESKIDTYLDIFVSGLLEKISDFRGASQ